MSAGSRFELEKRVRELERVSRGAWASVQERDVEVEALSRREEEYVREIESLRTKVVALDKVRDMAICAQSQSERFRLEVSHWRRRAEDADSEREQIRIELDETSKKRAELEEKADSLKASVQAASRARDEADESTRRVSQILERERASISKMREALAKTQRKLDESLAENDELRQTKRESQRVEASLRGDLENSQFVDKEPPVADSGGGREAARLRRDVRRLLQLLASTTEFAGFADDCEKDMSFVGQPLRCDYCRRPRDELYAWAPTEVVERAESLLPKDVAKRFLRDTNQVWARAYRKKSKDLEANFQRRIDDIFRKTQHGLPYDKVRNQQQVECLKQQIKQARTKHILKGRPKKTVSRHLPVQQRRQQTPHRRVEQEIATPASQSSTRQHALPSAKATTVEAAESEPVHLHDLELDQDYQDDHHHDESFFRRVEDSPLSRMS